MKDADERAGELSNLADRIERLERAHTPAPHFKPPPHRPTRPPISNTERKARRWFLAIASAWGALVYAVMLFQGWGSTSAWEKIAFGLVVALCVFVVYGFHIFYAELGKSAVRMFRGKKTDK